MRRRSSFDMNHGADSLENSINAERNDRPGACEGDGLGVDGLTASDGVDFGSEGEAEVGGIQ